jgi:hypothetical protein
VHSLDKAVGDGQDPEPLAPVRGADIVCSQHAPFRIEPRFGQVSEYGSKVVVGDGFPFIQTDSPTRLTQTDPNALCFASFIETANDRLLLRP